MSAHGLTYPDLMVGVEVSGYTAAGHPTAARGRLKMREEPG
jgi:hypothetical protein